MRWKDTVSFTDLHPAMLLAALRIEQLCSGKELWITSGNDSTHMKNSKHYKGKALDFRTKTLGTIAERRALETKVKAALGPEFYVELEDAGKANEHLHVQFNG